MSTGGKTTSTTQIPRFLEDALKENIARAQAEQRIGYKPYYGPDVAAMTPAQTSAMANTNSMANAFGMQAPASQTAGMPEAQNYGGMMAYSSGDLFDQALANLQQRRPGQYQAYTDMFIDPQTGDMAQYDQRAVEDALVQGGVDPSDVAAVSSGDSWNPTMRTPKERYEAALASLGRASNGFSLKNALRPGGLLLQIGDAVAAPLNKALVQDYESSTPYTSSSDISYSADRVYKDTTGLSPTGSWNFNRD